MRKFTETKTANVAETMERSNLYLPFRLILNIKDFRNQQAQQQPTAMFLVITAQPVHSAYKGTLTHHLTVILHSNWTSHIQADQNEWNFYVDTCSIRGGPSTLSKRCDCNCDNFFPNNSFSAINEQREGDPRRHRTLRIALGPPLCSSIFKRLYSFFTQISLHWIWFHYCFSKFDELAIFFTREMCEQIFL